MTRVTSDVDVLNELFTAGRVSVFGDVFTLVGIMAVLVWMDWRLALVAFSCCRSSCCHAVVPPHVRESYRQVRLVDRAHQRLPAGAHLGHGHGAAVPPRGRDRDAFDEINRAHRDANLDSIFYYAVFYPAIELVSALAAALLLWVGGGWVLRDVLTLGSLVAFLQYSQRFFRPISDLSRSSTCCRARWRRPSASSRCSTRRSRSARRRGVPARRGGHPLRARHLRLRAGEPVLKDVSFEVLPGPAHRHRRAPPARARPRS
jgi:ATP-binding cassette subfamily B protein